MDDELSMLTWWQALWQRRAIRLATILGSLLCLVSVLLWAGLHPPKTIGLRGWNTQDDELPTPEPSAKLAPWFTPDPGAFQDLPLPSPGDWLWHHEERGQSFKRFAHEQHARPSKEEGKLYILPVGDFTEVEQKILEQVAHGCERYFQIPVTILDPWHPKPGELTSRTTSLSTQWLIRDIFEELPKRRPDDAYALLAVTMTDIWPGEGWNYVFGQANWDERIGVQSFARYDPAFGTRSGAVFENRNELILLRGLKVMTHEVGHMFGMRHCTAYACNMNGSNSLEESDTQPANLCPVCLQKLQHSTGFDPEVRYKQLEAFYTSSALEEQANWVKRRRERVLAR